MAYHLRTRRVATSFALTLAFRPVVHAQSPHAALPNRPLATVIVEKGWPQSFATMPSSDATLRAADVAYTAAKLGKMNRYDDQFEQLDLAAGLALRKYAQTHDRYDGFMAVESLNEIALRCEGVGRSNDAVRLLRVALEIAQPDHKLYEKYFLYSVQLNLAYALAQTGDTIGAAESCNAVSMKRISNAEIYDGFHGNHAVIQARKEIFCGEQATGLATLREQLSANPKLMEPHAILSDYFLATHQWAEAAREHELCLDAQEFKDREEYLRANPGW